MSGVVSINYHSFSIKSLVTWLSCKYTIDVFSRSRLPPDVDSLGFKSYI